MSKYQVGDLVEITDKLYGHDFEIGELVEVVRYSLVSDDYLVKSANGAHFYVTDEEISDIKVDIERDQPDFD